MEQSEPSVERWTTEVSQWSSPKNSFLKLELIDLKLLELNLIPFMLELLVNLVTPILECAFMWYPIFFLECVL